MLNTLGFHLTVPTALRFTERFLKIARATEVLPPSNPAVPSSYFSLPCFPSPFHFVLSTLSLASLAISPYF